MIFLLSSIPGHEYPDPGVPNADVMVHLAVYGLLGALCGRGLLRGWPAGREANPAAFDNRLLTGWGALVLAGGAATAYGLTDELHQWFVPGRNADWRDVMADAAGALLGAALIVRPWRKMSGRGGSGAGVLR